jgi:hypothetical protein
MRVSEGKVIHIHSMRRSKEEEECGGVWWSEGV